MVNRFNLNISEDAPIISDSQIETQKILLRISKSISTTQANHGLLISSNQSALGVKALATIQAQYNKILIKQKIVKKENSTSQFSFKVD